MNAAILTLVTLLASGMAFAGPPGEAGSRQAPMERLASDLNLNEQQKSEVQRIMDEHWKQRMAERERSQAELKQKLGSVLTPEQMQTWEERRKERRDWGKQRRFKHREGGAPAAQ